MERAPSQYSSVRFWRPRRPVLIKGERPWPKLVPALARTSTRQTATYVTHVAVSSTQLATQLPGHHGQAKNKGLEKVPEGQTDSTRGTAENESRSTACRVCGHCAVPPHPVQGWLIEGATSQVAKGHLDQRQSTPRAVTTGRGQVTRQPREDGKKGDEETVRTGQRASGRDCRTSTPVLTPTEL